MDVVGGVVVVDSSVHRLSPSPYEYATSGSGRILNFVFIVMHLPPLDEYILKITISIVPILCPFPTLPNIIYHLTNSSQTRRNSPKHPRRIYTINSSPISTRPKSMSISSTLNPSLIPPTLSWPPRPVLTGRLAKASNLS